MITKSPFEKNLDSLTFGKNCFEFSNFVDLTRFENKVICMSLNVHVLNLKFIKLKVPDCVHCNEA